MIRPASPSSPPYTAGHFIHDSSCFPLPHPRRCLYPWNFSFLEMYSFVNKICNPEKEVSHSHTPVIFANRILPGRILFPSPFLHSIFCRLSTDSCQDGASHIHQPTHPPTLNTLSSFVLFRGEKIDICEKIAHKFPINSRMIFPQNTLQDTCSYTTRRRLRRHTSPPRVPVGLMMDAPSNGSNMATG